MHKSILILATVFLVSCAGPSDPHKRAKVGAGVGAAVGAAIGSRSNRDDALKGAVIGGIAGAVIGDYMDRQAAELEKEVGGSGVSIGRDGDNIILNMPENITFATGKSTIKPRFQPVLSDVGRIFKKYNKTSLLIAGHTDSVGSLAMNQKLSENRANAVKSFMAGQGVSLNRMQAVGFGETNPIASNSNASGRAQNRRVEITISKDN